VSKRSTGSTRTAQARRYRARFLSLAAGSFHEARHPAHRINRELTHAVAVPQLALTLQAALDDWQRVEPHLQQVYAALNAHDPSLREVVAFSAEKAMAPLPRAYHWVDGSAYVNHVELVRKARGAEMPQSYWSDPLVYQGGSDDLLGACEDARFVSEEHGIDLEAEVAVITDDVPMGVTAQSARNHIRLLLLVNDWSLRNLIPGELGKSFGFYQSKPATAFSPVAVTVDELGAAWDGGKVHLPLVVHVNGQLLGKPNAGVDMTFDFPTLLAHVTKTRNARAGTILGSGTVSNYDRSLGSACLAERRTLEQLQSGKPVTPFLRFGDRVRVEMLDAQGHSIFGAIDQRVVAAA
jgi:fumarylacetoacetate (FAA) hydrolase